MLCGQSKGEPKWEVLSDGEAADRGKRPNGADLHRAMEQVKGDQARSQDVQVDGLRQPERDFTEDDRRHFCTEKARQQEEARIPERKVEERTFYLGRN